MRFMLRTHWWLTCFVLFKCFMLCVLYFENTGAYYTKSWFYASLLQTHWWLMYFILFMSFMLCFILQTLVINMLCFLCFLCFEHTDDQYTLVYDFVFSSFPVFQFQLRNSFLLLPRDFSQIFIKVFAQNIWKTSS